MPTGTSIALGGAGELRTEVRGGALVRALATHVAALGKPAELHRFCAAARADTKDSLERGKRTGGLARGLLMGITMQQNDKHSDVAQGQKREPRATCGVPSDERWGFWIDTIVRLGMLGVTAGWLAGCTTLGPVPTVTGQAVSPEPRSNVEAQIGAVPGYFLSSAAQSDPKGSPIQQGSGMFDPEELIDVKGVGIGGRIVGGGDEGPYGEPMVRYRTYVDAEESFAMGGLLYGTKASGGASHASYSMTRIGGEYALDFRLTPKSNWAEVHLTGGLGLLSLSASGHYCQGTDGFGTDCDEQSPNADASISGFYPTVFAGANFDFARHLESVFHGARLGLLFAAGQMPSVKNGEQQSSTTYTSGGATLTLMLGGL